MPPKVGQVAVQWGLGKWLPDGGDADGVRLQLCKAASL